MSIEDSGQIEEKIDKAWGNLEKARHEVNTNRFLSVVYYSISTCASIETGLILANQNFQIELTIVPTVAVAGITLLWGFRNTVGFWARGRKMEQARGELNRLRSQQRRLLGDDNTS